MKKTSLIILFAVIGIVIILQLINDNDLITRILGAIQIVLICILGYSLGKNKKKKI